MPIIRLQSPNRQLRRLVHGKGTAHTVDTVDRCDRPPRRAGGDGCSRVRRSRPTRSSSPRSRPRSTPSTPSSTDLDNQAEIATEEFNQASVQLERTTAQVDTAQNDLDNTRAALASRTRSSPSASPTSTATATSPPSKSCSTPSRSATSSARVKFLNTISLSDASKAAGLKAQKQLTETQLEQLQAAQAKAQELSFELKAREIEVQLRIAEQQKLLDSSRQTSATSSTRKRAERQDQQIPAPAGALGRSKDGHRRHAGHPGRDRARLPRRPVPLGRRDAVAASTAPASCSTSSRSTACNCRTTPAPSSCWARRSRSRRSQPGDVVFFGSPVHHVGIYVGGGYFIHAPAHRRLRQDQQARRPQRLRRRPPLPVGHAYRSDRARRARGQQRAERGALELCLRTPPARATRSAASNSLHSRPRVRMR